MVMSIPSRLSTSLEQKITNETAMTNIKRISEFLPNQWPYTLDLTMSVMLDGRYLQAIRGPVCNTQIIRATALKVISLFDEKSDEHEAEKKFVQDKFPAIDFALENIALAFSYYKKLSDEINAIRALWKDSWKKVYTEKTIFIPARVVKSREKIVGEENILLAALPENFLNLIIIPPKLKQTSYVSLKPVCIGKLETQLMDTAVFRRASMNVRALPPKPMFHSMPAHHFQSTNYEIAVKLGQRRRQMNIDDTNFDE